MLIPPNSQSLLFRPHCITVPELRFLLIVVGRAADEAEEVDMTEMEESVRSGMAGLPAGLTGEVDRRDSPGLVVRGVEMEDDISLGGDLARCLEPKKERLVEARVSEGRA
ncbi:MAG: hypothetical protein Q9227_008352 [Pyrenula ochraceoflavens]